MLHIFRCMMTTHVVVQKNEPYISTGDRPLWDTCYDMAEQGSINLTPLNMTICVKLTVDMYIRSICIRY